MSWKWVTSVAVVMGVVLSCGQTAAAASSGTVSVTVQIRRPQPADNRPMYIGYNAINILSQVQARQIRAFW